MSDNTINLEELEWLAFCYAAGELTDEPLARFEALLAHDERAVLALAQAMELTNAVVSVERDLTNSRGVDRLPQSTAGIAERPTASRPAISTVIPASRTTAARRFTDFAAPFATACGIAFVTAALTWAVRGIPDQSPSTGTPTVATLWIENGSDSEEETRRDQTDPESRSTVALAAAAVLETDETTDEGGVPDWLLAALNQEQQSPVAQDNVLRD